MENGHILKNGHILRKGFVLLNSSYLDKRVIAKRSEDLFKIDPVSRQILVVIAKKGPLTVYRLIKGVRTEKSSRPSIYRRLRGEGRFPGLLENDFLKMCARAKFRNIKGVWKKFYGLTFKGLLACLSHLKLEETYLGRPFFNDIQQRSRSQEMMDAAKNYIKAELALWMQLHFEHGLFLTHLKTPEQWYRSSRSSLFGLFLYKHITEEGRLKIVTDFSDETSSLRETLGRHYNTLVQKLNSLEPKLCHALEFEIGDWPLYMRSLHELGKESIDKELARDRPIGEPRLLSGGALETRFK